MSSLLDLLTSQLGGEQTRQISRAIGADEASTSKAISGALPMLLGALSNNAGASDGASALAGALDRDHDGSILDDLNGFLGRGDTSPGTAILGHVLGGRQAGAEAGLSQLAGIERSSAGKLLAMLAPVVMGALGKQKRQQGLDLGALTEMLGAENHRARRQAPDAMSVLGSLLDADGDGSVADDVGGLLGGLLGHKG
jgi:hypothetical protein